MSTKRRRRRLPGSDFPTTEKEQFPRGPHPGPRPSPSRSHLPRFPPSLRRRGSNYNSSPRADVKHPVNPVDRRHRRKPCAGPRSGCLPPRLPFPRPGLHRCLPGTFAAGCSTYLPFGLPPRSLFHLPVLGDSTTSYRRSEKIGCAIRSDQAWRSGLPIAEHPDQPQTS